MSCLPRSSAAASRQLVRALFLARLGPPATGRAGHYWEIFKYQNIQISEYLFQILFELPEYLHIFLDAIASPSTYPGHWVSQ